MLPYRFTGKELDRETGLYYYGARYLDPKRSRWISSDPAFEEYLPVPPVDEEARKHNENLPGMGGVFNLVNLNTYHYSGNNPVKYIDPDGKAIETPWDLASAALGAVSSYLSYKNKNYIGGTINLLGAMADSAAAIVPGIPGGVSVGIKTAQYGSRASNALESITRGIIDDDAFKIGVGVMESIGMGLGKSGSKYLNWASEAFTRAKSVPKTMKVGMIYSGLLDKHKGIFMKAMSIVGVSAEAIIQSYNEYKNYKNQEK
jgi:uncharacterized protein RhaS with RHS repeats